MDLVDQVVLTDILEGIPQGLALDMNQARPVEKYRTIVVGTNSYEDTAGSEVVLITAGSPRKPGMSRMDLLTVNAKVVKSVTEQVMKYSPDAILVVVTNPLDHMTTLAAEVSGLPKNKVMGQAGILDSSRLAHFISEMTGEDVLEIEALTLGSHGPTMVPVPSRCKVAGKALDEVLSEEQIEGLIDRTRKGGAEIVGLLKTGSAYYAPSSAAAAMVEAILTDSGAVLPVCAWTGGAYGVAEGYLGVTARIGAKGVDEIVELPLTNDEMAALHEAAEAVAANVAELYNVDYS
jgi:malate dehydrogenase